MADSAHSTRRAFLKSAAAVSVLPIAGCAEIALASAKEDPELEIFRLARELHAKVKAHYGGTWQFIHNQDSGALFFIPIKEPRIVEFDGPGWYEVEDGSPERVEVMWLKVDHRFPPHPRDGRFFKATPKNEGLHSRHYGESWLRQIIVRKIGT